MNTHSNDVESTCGNYCLLAYWSVVLVRDLSLSLSLSLKCSNTEARDWAPNQFGKQDNDQVWQFHLISLEPQIEYNQGQMP